MCHKVETTDRPCERVVNLLNLQTDGLNTYKIQISTFLGYDLITYKCTNSYEISLNLTLEHKSLTEYM